MALTDPAVQSPETTVELREIGTDPLRLEAFSRDFRRHLGEGWFGEYGKIKTILDPKGYVAPPLDGVWATAPYLHNGSVPTLADLLNPDQRPKAWRRTPDGYDQQKVGIEVETLAEAPNSTGPGVVRNYYDTSLPGLGNGGHRFPPKPLSERDQKALLGVPEDALTGAVSPRRDRGGRLIPSQGPHAPADVSYRLLPRRMQRPYGVLRARVRTAVRKRGSGARPGTGRR